MVINLLAYVNELVWWCSYDVLAGQVNRRAKGMLDVLCSVGEIWFIFARTFIVVEVLLSLRSQLKKAYVEIFGV